jgi:pilus assembly protein Flp/PilA
LGKQRVFVPAVVAMSAPVNPEGTFLMLKYYIKASDLVERLRTDKAGVVSFEYVIVAACVVAAVAAAFGSTTGGNIQNALKGAITSITTAVTNATAG